MGYFTAELQRILDERQMTQADLAKLCGVSQPTMSDYFREEIEVTRKNLAKILRGVSTRPDQIRLLTAYLEDQIPKELRDAVTIVTTEKSYVAEHSAPIENPIEVALRGIPTSTQKSVLALLDRLKDDTDLCSLVERTIAYLGDEDARVRHRSNRALGENPPVLEYLATVAGETMRQDAKAKQARPSHAQHK